MTSENVQVEQVDRFMADAAFDIAFRGDTDGIDEVMADLFARHRLAATREVEAEVERARRIIKGWADWHRMVEDGPKDDLPYLNGKAWDDAEALADNSKTFLRRAALAGGGDA